MGLVCCQQVVDGQSQGGASFVKVETSTKKPQDVSGGDGECQDPNDALLQAAQLEANAVHQVELVPSSLEPIKLAEIPNSDVPPAPAQCITVTIVKASKEEKLGLDLTHCKHYLLIGRIYPNLAAARHNMEADGEKLFVGDKIIEVNGIRGSDEDMVAACKEESVVMLKVIRRPAPSKR
mmetsp:Transcript_58567/g.136835  ORF Transcript_58567/g.136835 Transcript_58567/m.136835 type:complete len:179 (+) Transcript_58567:65-601(+)